jgi:hypothetical protein
MFIAGIIVRRVPTATVEIVPILNGLGVTDERHVADALSRFSNRPDVGVINMSLGGTGDPQHPPVGIAKALATLPSTTAVVASAGNNHTNQPMYPAAFARVIGVAAWDSDRGAPATFSNYGPWVDCHTPGVDVQSAFDNWSGLVATAPQSSETFKGWAVWSGTSFAAPKVTAAIAAKVASGMTGLQAAAALLSDPSLIWRPDYGWFLNLP